MNSTASAPARSGLETIPGLNGLRAVAVLLVFFAHSGLATVVPGGLGVTVFFVLSGFLITTLMIMEQQRSGRIHFGSFYLRRVVRLAPPLVVIAALALLLSETGIISGRFSPLGLLSVLAYFGNYFCILSPASGMPAGLNVIWSLAVEEHFYLFYPPLAALLLSRARARTSAMVLGALCLVVLAWRCVLVGAGFDEMYIGYATDTRIDAILVGCVMAFARNPWLSAPAAPRPLFEAGLAVSCLLLLALSVAWRNEVFRLTLRYTLQSVAIAPLVWLAVARPDSPLARWLNSRFLVYLGTVSYSFYLSHHVIMRGLEKYWPEHSWLAFSLVAATLTLIVCEVMRRWVENPSAALRRRLHARVLGKPAAAPVVKAAGYEPRPQGADT